jgi:glutathione synthase
MKIGLIANPVEYDLNKDLDMITPSSTALLGNRFLNRDHQVYTFNPQDIGVYQNQVRGKAKLITGQSMQGFCSEAFDENGTENIHLNEMDVIFPRSLPGEVNGKPNAELQQEYFNLLGLLETLKKPYLINNPTGVKIAYDKTALIRFADIIPETSILNDPNEIYNLVKQYGMAVTKPLSGYGGEGIEKHVRHSVFVMDDLIRITDNGKKSVIVQDYVKGVEEFGDKRIFVWKGQPLGGFARIPKKGDFRSNVHVGAKMIKTELNDRDYEICAILKPFLIENGLNLVGIDVVGRFLMEINVRSPGGMEDINKFNNVSLDEFIVNEIEKCFN